MEGTLISGTMIRDLLICERRLALDLRGDPGHKDPTSPFVKMLWREGLAHEDAILGAIGAGADLRRMDRRERELETVRAMEDRAPIILGAVLLHEDTIGMPDVLRLTDRGYVAQDVKAGGALDGTRGTYKPEYLCQVAHYAAQLHATGNGPRDVAAIIGRDGLETTYDLELPLGRARMTGIELHSGLLDRARRIVAGNEDTRAALGAKCGLCEWNTRCRDELAAADDLTLITGLGRAVREPMELLARSVAELAAIAPSDLRAVPGVGVDRLRRFGERAKLLADPEAGPIVREPLEFADNPHNVDFDVEADPLRGIVYLHGFWHSGHRADAAGEFVHFYADTPDASGERDAFAAAIEHFRAYRSAHWWHYSSYERTSYRDLQRRHPDVCGEDEIDAIFAPERCTDLYAVVARKTDWPLSSYGIKSLAKAVGFSWEDASPGGANSIEWYDRWVTDRDPALRERIVAYNRDDVIASWRLRQAMMELEDTGRIVGFRRPMR